MKIKVIGVLVVIGGLIFNGFLPGGMAQSASKAEFEGELEVLVSEGDSRTQRLDVNVKYEYILVEKNGKRYKLNFTNETPSALSGSKVRVKPSKVESDTLTVDSGSTDMEVLSLTTPSEYKKTAVILINFTNNTSQPYTTDYAKGVTFTNANSSSAHLQESSFDKLGLTGFHNADGDVYGWYTLPYTSDNCSYNTWALAADNAAAADGYSMYNYNDIIYAFPNVNSCSWWGLGTIGGNPGRAWINGSYVTRVVAHEQGHNWALYHSHSQVCYDENNNRVSISNNCVVDEYGDMFDVMGGSTGHFSVSNKAKMNFFDAGNVLTVTEAEGDYTIVPLEQSNLGIQMLKIPRVYNGTLVDYYTVSFRQPYGFDSGFNPSVYNGASVHLVKTADNGPSLLDMTPETSAMDDGSLKLGRSFTDSVNQITITATDVNPNSVTVHVSMVPKVCTPQSPQASLSPTTRNANAGSTAAYTLVVVNKDQNCPDSTTFSISPTLPEGWTQTMTGGTSTFVLAPNQQAIRTLLVRSDVSAIPDTYQFTETIADVVDPTHAGTVTGTYIVNPQVCILTNPLVTITPANQSATAGSTLDYNVAVTNRDNSYCPFTTFDLTSSLASNFIQTASAESVALAPGATTNITVSLSSTPDSLPGNYQFSETLTDSANPSHAGMGPGIYSVIGCTTANPTVTISPSTQSAYSGQSLNYTVTVMNNNSSLCSDATYTITPTLDAGLSQSPSSQTFTIASAQSSSFTAVISTPVSQASGSYQITQTAVDNSNSSLAGSVSATLVVTASDTTLPTVNITQPANGATVKGTFTISATASDASGIATIKLYIDNVLRKTCNNVTSCSMTYNANNLSRGNHLIKATATDKGLPTANTAETIITVIKK